MKYIRTEILGIVMFSETQSHKNMANRVMSHNDKLISAGFVKADEWCDDGQVCVGGESTTLRLEPKPEDEGILRGMLRR
jgi:hypothetical protein